ncbi:MAG: hypothetical protein KDE32_10625 [Novosphingobium sp.]|nr:hypothetical protein [Novosphingobium sp.]
MTDEFDAREALAAVKGSEGKLADRMTWPLWRHMAIGLVFNLLIYGQTRHDDNTSLAISTMVMFASILLIQYDRRHTGLHISGLRVGRTMWVAIAQIAIVAGAMFFVRSGIPDPIVEQPAYWALQIGVFASSFALSKLFERLYRADVRGGRA